MLQTFPIPQTDWHRLNAQSPFGIPSFERPLQTSLTEGFSLGSGTPTYSRASVGEHVDFEAVRRQVPSGVFRPQGARLVYNLIQGSSEVMNGASYAEYQITKNATGFTEAAANDQHILFQTTPPFVANHTYVVRVEIIGIGRTWVRSSFNDGTRQGYWFNLSGAGSVGSQSGTKSSAPGITLQANGNYLITYKVISTTVVEHVAINGATADAVETYLGDVAKGYTVTKWQVEDVTGQANQNPSEYVSVGVLASPWHGAGVDGVKYFSTTNGNTVAANVVTEAVGAPINSVTSKFAALPTAVSATFSTPDSAAASITGDIDLRVFLSMDDWTNAANPPLIYKWAALPSYRFLVWNDGLLMLDASPDGLSNNIAFSTVAVDFTDGTAHWVRATRSASSGSVNFYTSSDGITWLQLGSANVATTAGGIFDSTSSVMIANSNLAGRIYRAQIYNGINGTLAVDFNPNLSTTAQTFTAATGEVWTTNGNARIFGNTHATYGIPAQWDAGGPLGYLAEGARTNLKIQSAGYTGWGTEGASLTQNSIVSPDGTTTATLTTDDTLNGVHGSFSQLTGLTAGATHTFSVFVKAGTRSTVRVRWETGSNASGCYASVNLATGTITGTGTMGTGTYTSSSILACPNSWYLITLTGKLDASSTIGYSDVYGEEAGNITYVGTSKTWYVWGYQVEEASFASSYIPTTTVAVTRAADSLTYATAGNFSDTAGTMYAETAQTSWANAAGSVIGSATQGMMPISSNSGVQGYDGTNTVQGTAGAPSGLVKMAVTWSGSTMNVGAAGTAVTTGNYDGTWNFATIGIGTGGYGTHRFVKIWPGARSNSQLVQMTTP